jgi:hypothetical protein
MPHESIVTTSSLLLVAHRTSRSARAVVVYGALVPRKIIRPREDRVARLIGRWIDARALVWSGLDIVCLNSSEWISREPTLSARRWLLTGTPVIGSRRCLKRRKAHDDVTQRSKDLSYCNRS